jgi:hypothetical protein
VAVPDVFCELHVEPGDVAGKDGGAGADTDVEELRCG